MPNSQQHLAARDLERLFNEGSLSALSDSALLRRFVAQRDESAFSALVDRHGGMVFSVCRAILRDPRDVEDAFQVTFMVLVKSARLIWIDGSLGGWLHRVARRVANQTRRQVMRRRQREGAAPIELEQAPARHDRAGDFAELHEAIDRLPEQYRRAVVPCYLEGMTQPQAAQTLKCGEATLRRRLVGARKRLESRLSKGDADAMFGGVAGAAHEWSRGGIPVSLVESTIQAAIESVSPIHALAGTQVVSKSVVTLARGAFRMMIVQSLKWPLVSGLLVAGVIGTAVIAQPGQVVAQPGQAAAPKPPEPPENVQKARQPPDLKAMTRRIEESLDQKIDLDVGELTLDQMLKTIKKATTTETYQGIPIYVDPVGLTETVSLHAQVMLRYKQARVRDILDKELRTLKLGYRVKDGYLMISSRTEILDRRVADIESKLDRVLEALDRLERSK